MARRTGDEQPVDLAALNPFQFLRNPNQVAGPVILGRSRVNRAGELDQVILL